MSQCTADLATHDWRPLDRLSLSLVDTEGFFEVLLRWRCVRCQRYVWADGVIHLTTPPLTPVEWEALTANRSNIWQQQVERITRYEHQQAYLQHRMSVASSQTGRA